MATIVPPVRPPTIWWGFDVVFDGCADFDDTCAHLEFFKKRYLPHANKEGDHKPHATVLYHGAASATVLRDAKLEDQYNCAMIGEFRGLERHSSPDNTRHFLTASFMCEPLQDLHVALRKQAEAISGEKSKQQPHVGPGGEHLHKHDVNPHITLAEYKTRTAMDADYEELVVARGDELLLGPVGMRRRLRLGPLKVHYG
jgi:hypothetical protein